MQQHRRRARRERERPTVAVLSRQGRASVDSASWAALEAVADVRAVALDRAPGSDEAAELLWDVDLLASTNLCLPELDAALLDRLPRLRGVVLLATGYDHLDVELLRDRGIGLSVLPDYATVAVAEHGLAMLLALATRLHLAHDRARGVAPATASLRGVELAGRTVGVVGLGRIGTHLASLCRGIGMTVVGTDIDRTAAARARATGVATGSLPWLLASSDAVVLCASHRHGAPPIIGEDELLTLRPGSFLVNVARAGLVDAPAALAAVRAGRLRGYAVDDAVVDLEADGDLLTEGRVLQTGHSAWWRDEVLERGARMWGERIVAAAEGTPIDVVTWPGRTGEGDDTSGVGGIGTSGVGGVGAGRGLRAAAG